MIGPITIKQVLTQEGSFSHLELWQGNQHIKITNQFTQKRAGNDIRDYETHKWSLLKSMIDDVLSQVYVPKHEMIEEYGKAVKERLAQ